MTLPCDIHTHRPDIHPHAIISVSPRDFAPKQGKFYSVGIHPWDTAAATDSDLQLLARTASHPQVVAIGECGIDRLHGASPETQTHILAAHIQLAEQLHKPLILHIVRAAHLLPALRKQYRPRQKWIIHGFRNNAATARQLLAAGCDLSFGERYNPEALQATPLDRLWVESDESLFTDEQLYTRIAHDYPCPVGTLRQAIGQRMEIMFFSMF